MNNPYMDMLQPGAAANAEAADPTKNEYLGLLEGAADRQKQALAGALTQAFPVNPDQYSTQRKVAGYLGYPLAAVEAMPGLADQAKMQRVQTDIARAPVLAKRYTDGDFAKLAHDDSGVLSTLETSLSKAARYVVSADRQSGLVRDLYSGAYLRSVEGTAGFFRGASEVAAAPLNALGLDEITAIGGNPLQRLAEGFSAIARRAEADRKRLTPDTGDFVGDAVSSGVQSGAQNLKYAPLAFMGPPGIAAALAGMVAEAGGTTYQGDREKGVSVGTAATHATADMVAEYTTEKYLGVAGFLQKVAAGSAAGKLAMYEITRELPGEMAATVWQNFNEWSLVDKSKSLHDFIAEQPAAIGQTIIATIVGGGVQIGASKASMHVAQAAIGRQFETVQAAQQAEALQHLMAAAPRSRIWP